MEKKEMNIEAFTKLNTQISELIKILDDYDSVDITEARKSLKNAGMRIGSYYFRYEQKEPMLKIDTDEKAK